MGVYYSRYQLLALRALPLVQSRLTARRVDRTIEWTLPALSAHERSMHEHGRALAIVLEILSSRYRPRVMQVYRSPSDDFVRFVGDEDPAIESAFLGSVTPELLVRQAEVLLSSAKSFDPLGEWRRVSRVGAPSRWDELRNDALLAQEMRIAAEMALRYVEDEAAQGRASPLLPVSSQWWEPRHERLKITPRERSETIMDFRLSDRSAIYLALEGQTEVTIATRLLALAGYEPLSTWVTLVDLEGVGGDVGLLARALAVPRLDPDGHVGARITAPLSALVVAADPEGNYVTDASRLKVRDMMIEHVLKSLPTQLRTDGMRRDLEHLIHVRSWPAEFEFAHFSDAVLARAIRKVVSTAPPVADLKLQLAACRKGGGSIKSVWKKWKIQPSKVELADQLWPDLNRRVRDPRHHRALPIVDLLEEALRIAQEVRQAREMAVDG